MSDRIGLSNADDLRQRSWFSRRMERQAGLSRLEQLLALMREALEAQGMEPASIEALLEQLSENAAGFAGAVGALYRLAIIRTSAGAG